MKLPFPEDDLFDVFPVPVNLITEKIGRRVEIIATSQGRLIPVKD